GGSVPDTRGRPRSLGGAPSERRAGPAIPARPRTPPPCRRGRSAARCGNHPAAPAGPPQGKAAAASAVEHLPAPRAPGITRGPTPRTLDTSSRTPPLLAAPQPAIVRGTTRPRGRTGRDRRQRRSLVRLRFAFAGQVVQHVLELFQSPNVAFA